MKPPPPTPAASSAASSSPRSASALPAPPSSSSSSTSSSDGGGRRRRVGCPISPRNGKRGTTTTTNAHSTTTTTADRGGAPAPSSIHAPNHIASRKRVQIQQLLGEGHVPPSLQRPPSHPKEVEAGCDTEAPKVEGVKLQSSLPSARPQIDPSYPNHSASPPPSSSSSSRWLWAAAAIGCIPAVNALSFASYKPSSPSILLRFLSRSSSVPSLAAQPISDDTQLLSAKTSLVSFIPRFNWKVIAVVFPVGLMGSIMFFEQARWWWFRDHRQRAVRRHWERAGRTSTRRRAQQPVTSPEQATVSFNGACADNCCDYPHNRHLDVLEAGLHSASSRSSAFCDPFEPRPSTPQSGDDDSDTIVEFDLSSENRSLCSSVADSAARSCGKLQLSSSHSGVMAIEDDDSETHPRESEWRQTLFHSLMVVGRFVNPFIEWQDRNTGDFFAYLTWQATRRCRNGVPTDKAMIDRTLPVVEPDRQIWRNFHSEAERAKIAGDPSPPLMSIAWFGQSTVFVQMDGYNILTDPIFSSRTVGEWVGPKRIQRVPCRLEDLPKIDIVLVSHNHYDHLDRAVVASLRNTVTWYIPLGLKEWFAGMSVTNVVELDWWQECLHEEKLRIIGTPIQHWSGRHFLDVNRSLWSSFVIKGPTASFFHVGDTGYCTAFKEIGARYGPFTFSAIPIGSYEPRYFMCHQHIDPNEAVAIHNDVGSRYSLGVHWGTFMMSDEHYLDPPKVFEQARKDAGAEGCFTLKLGQVVVLRDGDEEARGVRGPGLWSTLEKDGMGGRVAGVMGEGE